MTSVDVMAAKAAEAEAHKVRLAAVLERLYGVSSLLSHEVISHSPWGGTGHVVSYVDLLTGQTMYAMGKVNEDKVGARFEASNLELFGRIPGVDSAELLSPIEIAANEGVIVEEYFPGLNLQVKLDRNPGQRLPLFTFQNLLKQIVAVHSSYRLGGEFQRPGIRDSKFTSDLLVDPAQWKEAILKDMTLRGSPRAAVEAARSINAPLMIELLTTYTETAVRTWGDAKPYNVIDKPLFEGSNRTSPRIVDLQEPSIGSPFWDLAQLFEILPVQMQAAFFAEYVTMMREDHGMLTDVSDDFLWNAMAQAHMYNAIQGRGFALAVPGIELMDWKTKNADPLLVRSATVADNPTLFREMGESAHGYVTGRDQIMAPLSATGVGASLWTP